MRLGMISSVTEDINAEDKVRSLELNGEIKPLAAELIPPGSVDWELDAGYPSAIFFGDPSHSCFF